MFNNSTTPALSTLTTLNLIVGTAYIVEAVVVMQLHMICGYLMYTDNEMQNPTYNFMVNLYIVDWVELIWLGIYPGIVILTKWKPPDLLARIASWLSCGVWYSNCVLFVLIAFSRWIALTRPHMVKIVFRKKTIWALQIVSLLACPVLAFYANVLYPPGPVFPFIPELYTWDFDPDLPLGRFYLWPNLVFNALATFGDMIFNILSLCWVHRTRNDIQTFERAANRHREVLLLYQCLCLGIVLTATYVIFTTIFALQVDNLAAYIGFQWMWTLNHSINPMVYLTVNRKLRNRFIELFTCGKYGTSSTVGRNRVSPALNDNTLQFRGNRNTGNRRKRTDIGPSEPGQSSRHNTWFKNLSPPEGEVSCSKIKK